MAYNNVPANKPPRLREILEHRQPDDADYIHVAPLSDYNSDIYAGPVGQCPDEVQDLRIRAWLRHDGIYIV